MELALLVCNVMIVVTGVPAIYCVNLDVGHKFRRYGCIFGCIGIPFWFGLSIMTQNHGLTVINVAYSISWILGFYNNWILVKKKNQSAQAQLDWDLATFGTSFGFRHNDGRIERIDPSDIYIKPKEEQDDEFVNYLFTK